MIQTQSGLFPPGQTDERNMWKKPPSSTCSSLTYMISWSVEKDWGQGHCKDLMRWWVVLLWEALSDCVGTGDQRRRFLTQARFYWLCDCRQVPWPCLSFCTCRMGPLMYTSQVAEKIKWPTGPLSHKHFFFFLQSLYNGTTQFYTTSVISLFPVW